MKLDSLTKPKFKNTTAIVLIVVFTFLLYGKILSYSFVSDDYLAIVKVESFLKENSNIKTLFLISEENKSFRERLIDYSFSAAEASFRPVKTLSLFLDYQTWGLNPFGFRLTNLILYLINGIFVYLLGKYLFKDVFPAFIGALIFLAHPVNTETLLVVSNRHDLLALFFYFLAFFAFIKFLFSNSHKRIIVSIVLSWLCYILAVLSKEVSITFLFIVGAFIGLHKDRTIFIQKRKALFLFFIGTVLITAIIVFMKIYYNFNINIQHKIYEAGFWVEILTIFKVFAEYLRWIVIPLDVKFYLVEQYPLAFKISFKLILDFIAVLGVASLLIRAILKSSFSRAFSGAWLLLTLIPLVAIRAIPSTMAARYLYIPMVGVSLFVASFLNNNIKFKIKIRRNILIVAVIIFYSVISSNLAYYWQNNLTLWDKMRRDFPKDSYINMQYYLNYGGVMAFIGRDREALESYLKAHFILPDNLEAVQKIKELTEKVKIN